MNLLTKTNFRLPYLFFLRLYGCQLFVCFFLFVCCVFGNCLLQVIASRDLENWALIQPGGDTLMLKIKVEMEEKLYLRQILPTSTLVKPVNPTSKQLGKMKAIKLTFSDRYSTQVVFHIKKKKSKKVRSLRQLAALVVSDSLRSLGEPGKLAQEGVLPAHLVPDLEAAWTNCWTQRLAFLGKFVACMFLLSSTNVFVMNKWFFLWDKQLT